MLIFVVLFGTTIVEYVRGTSVFITLGKTVDEAYSIVQDVCICN